MKDLRNEEEEFASSWVYCRLWWKLLKFALEGHERQGRGEAESKRVISHHMGTGRVRWKHPAVINRGKYVFTQHTVRLPKLLPGVVMQGQTGNCFKKTVHSRWIYLGPLVSKLQLQSLAQKARNLRVAREACRGEFVPYALFPKDFLLDVAGDVVLT